MASPPAPCRAIPWAHFVDHPPELLPGDAHAKGGGEEKVARLEEHGERDQSNALDKFEHEKGVVRAKKAQRTDAGAVNIKGTANLNSRGGGGIMAKC